MNEWNCIPIGCLSDASLRTTSCVPLDRSLTYTYSLENNENRKNPWGCSEVRSLCMFLMCPFDLARRMKVNAWTYSVAVYFDVPTIQIFRSGFCSRKSPHNIVIFTKRDTQRVWHAYSIVVNHARTLLQRRQRRLKIWQKILICLTCPKPGHSMQSN